MSGRTNGIGHERDRRLAQGPRGLGRGRGVKPLPEVVQQEEEEGERVRGVFGLVQGREGLCGDGGDHRGLRKEASVVSGLKKETSEVFVLI